MTAGELVIKGVAEATGVRGGRLLQDGGRIGAGSSLSQTEADS